MASSHALQVALPSVEKAQIKLTPQYCVVEQKENPCDTQITVSWVLPDETPVCLKENQRLLSCWDASKTGTWRYKAKVQLPTIYSITHAHTGELVVDTQLELQTSRSSRRRLRSVWSFF
ncbi:DUF3019 domain-containing protein [Pseudoalteromonas sp. GB56]